MPSLSFKNTSIEIIIRININPYVSRSINRLTCNISFLRNKQLIANTNAIFAMFDPNALPIAILDLPSKLDMIEINISGEDVAKPIKIKLDKK